MTDAIRELFELLTKKEKSGSDYTGTVTRVDGKTAYVQFDGSSITDTPVALSIGAKWLEHHGYARCAVNRSKGGGFREGQGCGRSCMVGRK